LPDGFIGLGVQHGCQTAQRPGKVKKYYYPVPLTGPEPSRPDARKGGIRIDMYAYPTCSCLWDGDMALGEEALAEWLEAR